MKSARLEYRGAEPADAEQFCIWLNDEETRRFLDHRVMPMGEVAEREFLEKLSGSASMSRGDVIFYAEDPSLDTPVGATGLHSIHWIARSAEWGIVVAPEHRGRGYGTEMGKRILDHAFDGLNLERVWLRVCAEHTAGLKCYESIGFVREGVLRHAFWLNGTYYDTVMMSALADEWRAAR